MGDLTIETLLNTFSKYRPIAPGYQPIESIYLTDWYELLKIKRTFRERFFTKPWMPWIKYAFEPGPQEPLRAVYMMGDKIIGHPVTLKKIKEVSHE